MVEPYDLIFGTIGLQQISRSGCHHGVLRVTDYKVLETIKEGKAVHQAKGRR
jgi:hypothetical protein